MSIHNICFHGEIGKTFSLNTSLIFELKLDFTGPVNTIKVMSSLEICLRINHDMPTNSPESY